MKLTGSIQSRGVRLKDVRRRLEAAARSRVEVGVFDPDVAEIYATHEFGSMDGRIPARSSLRSTMRERRGQVAKDLAAAARAVTRGERGEGDALEAIGSDAAEAVRRKILDSHIPPPLKPRTVRRKGNDHPLVGATDEGRIVRSITHRVRGQ